MKKVIKWFLILFLALLAILILLPFAFQGKITQMVKDEINNNVNAQVDFDQVSISFLSAFPNVSIKVSDLSVIGREEFSGDTLAFLQQFQLKVSLMSVLNDPLEIRSIIIEHPHVYAKILENGKANWDIVFESKDAEEASKNEESTNMVIRLKEFKIDAANILYEDQTMNLLTDIRNMDFLLSGDLSADNATLSTQTKMEAFTLTMDGISYLTKTKMDLNADLDADLKNSKYTFKDNNLLINDLEIGFDGSIAMPNDDISIDMTFDAKKSSFKQILSLVPAIYMTDFKDIKTSGEISLNAFIKGVYNETQLPSFDVNLLVNNGQFQYPDLPSKMENISVGLNVKNEDGIEDHTFINLKTFHFDMAGNPFDMSMKMSSPVSDPNIDGRIDGVIDLSKMKDIIPADNMNLTGIITANVELKGKMSSIEKEDYDAFHAVGNLSVSKLNFADTDFPQGIEISNAKASLSPQYIKVDEFDATVGKSDLHMQGKIENFLAYYFNDELLRGNFSFTSKLIDLSDFMGDESEESGEIISESDSGMTVIEIPKNIDFILNTAIKTLLYDGLEIKNMTGGLTLKDGIAMMNNLQMQMLDGSLKMNGQYSTQNIEKPAFNFDLDAQNFNVKKTFEAFNTIQKIAPIAKNMGGDVSAKLNVSGLVLQNMEPDLQTINSRGRLQSNNISLKNADLFQQIGSLIKTDRFNQLTFGKIDLSYTMEEGQLKVKPFDTKFGHSKMTIGGSQRLDQKIDYGINFTVPSSEFGAQANAVANQLLGEVGKFGVDLKAPESIKFKALVGGTLTAPKVSLDLKNSAGNIVDDLKKQAEQKLKEEADKAKAKAIEEAKKQAAALMTEADKQGKKLIAEAQKAANQAKSEANKQAEAAKAEAYKQADLLVKDAGSDSMKKLLAQTAAKKAKSEADKIAESAKKEAAKQADKGVLAAEQKAALLKEIAKKEGDQLIQKAAEI